MQVLYQEDNILLRFAWPGKLFKVLRMAKRDWKICQFQ